MSIKRFIDPQFDLFIHSIIDLPLRDQRETMERPFFSLSKRKRLLDVYAWLAQRLCRVTKPQCISWVALKDQFGFGYSRMDNFKAGFRAVLGDVCRQYRQAKVDLDDRGMSLQTSSPPVPGRLLIV